MINNPSQKLHRTTVSQVDVSPLPNRCCLSELSPELLMKIANLASDSMGNLRLTCKQIEGSLRQTAKKASLKRKVQSSSNDPICLSADRFDALTEINLKYIHYFHRLDKTTFPHNSNIQKLVVGAHDSITDIFINSISLLQRLRVLKLDHCYQ